MKTPNQINDQIVSLANKLWKEKLSEIQIVEIVKDIRFLGRIAEEEIVTHISI